MGWGKSKKAAEPEGGRGRGPGDRKAPDVGLTSCYDFIQYLGSGGSGTVCPCLLITRGTSLESCCLIADEVLGSRGQASG